MAANYKTITFRLDMNNPVDHKLYDTLTVQQTTSARNKLIKDVLIRALLDGTAGEVSRTEADDGEWKHMLEVMCNRIEALEKRFSASDVRPQREQASAQPEIQREHGMPQPVKAKEQAEDKALEAFGDMEVSEEALSFLAKGGFS